jgi:hypothetical protein
MTAGRASGQIFFFLKVTVSRGGPVPIHLNLHILIATHFKILNPYNFDLSLLGFLNTLSEIVIVLTVL